MRAIRGLSRNPLVSELIFFRGTLAEEAPCFLHSCGTDVSCSLSLYLTGLHGSIDEQSKLYGQVILLGDLGLTISGKSFNFSEPVLLVVSGNYCAQSCWEDGI